MIDPPIVPVKRFKSHKNLPFPNKMTSEPYTGREKKPIKIPSSKKFVRIKFVVVRSECVRIIATMSVTLAIIVGNAAIQSMDPITNEVLVNVFVIANERCRRPSPKGRLHVTLYKYPMFEEEIFNIAITVLFFKAGKLNQVISSDELEQAV